MRKYNAMVASGDSKKQETEMFQKLLDIQGKEENQSNELLQQKTLFKRNKEILAEKNKLYNLIYKVDALKAEVDQSYINPRHEELKLLVTERGIHEREKKEFEILKSMQDDVYSSMLSAARARFEIPTNEEDQEFENKIFQEQEKLHKNKILMQLREQNRLLLTEKNELLITNQQLGST
jgi:hypothetical protein